MSMSKAKTNLEYEIAGISDFELVLSLKISWLGLEKANNLGKDYEKEAIVHREMVKIYETELMKRLESRHPKILAPNSSRH